MVTSQTKTNFSDIWLPSNTNIDNKEINKAVNNMHHYRVFTDKM